MSNASRSFAPLLASLLVMVLLGQAIVASASVCPGTMGTAGSMSAMDHSMHDLADQTMDNAAVSACCEEGGLCSMPECLTTVALPALPMTHLPPAVIILAITPMQIAIEFPFSPRFRPPIFA